MVVRLSIPLFGKPSWEMNIEGGMLSLRSGLKELRTPLKSWI